MEKIASAVLFSAVVIVAGYDPTFYPLVRKRTNDRHIKIGVMAVDRGPVYKRNSFAAVAPATSMALESFLSTNQLPGYNFRYSFM